MIRKGDVPNRIILSRKGFDSSWGGCPSPILGREMISLPIPEHSRKERASQGINACPKNHLTYRDLTSRQGRRVTGLIQQLSGGKINEADCVHLDPDIRPELRDSKDRKRPLTFGQSGGAQTELREIAAGALFLFFGWFRKANEPVPGAFRFAKDGANLHAIWGWLQIEERLDLPQELSRGQKIAAHHPHISHPSGRSPNCLYVAGNALTFLPQYAGAGAFSRFHDGLCLTDVRIDRNPRKLCSYWKLPAFLKEKNVSHIPKISEWDRDGDSILGQAANHPGQEFIFKTKGNEKEVAKWLDGIFGGKQMQSK